MGTIYRSDLVLLTTPTRHTRTRVSPRSRLSPNSSPRTYRHLYSRQLLSDVGARSVLPNDLNDVLPSTPHREIWTPCGTREGVFRTKLKHIKLTTRSWATNFWSGTGNSLHSFPTKSENLNLNKNRRKKNKNRECQVENSLWRAVKDRVREGGRVGVGGVRIDFRGITRIDGRRKVK